MNENRNCSKHGLTLFKFKKTKNKSWYSCHKCLQEQWRKASANRRKKKGIKEYHREYSKSYNSIRKSLSVYLAMILLAAKIKPE